MAALLRDKQQATTDQRRARNAVLLAQLPRCLCREEGVVPTTAAVTFSICRRNRAIITATTAADLLLITTQRTSEADEGR